jgi:glyoxylase-like metal-dependent hydrolase (beta-lactamase superfamily II)
VFISMIRTMPLLFLLSGFSQNLSAAENLAHIMQQYPPAPVEMTLKQVSEHVYYVEGAAGTALENEGFISNAGFVVTPAGVVVIDALGTPSLGAMLLKHIRSVTAQPIVKVITTHYHADHIYGLQVFKELGAEIIAPAGANTYLTSPNAAERLEERRFSLDPWVNDRTYLVTPNVLLTQSTEYELDGVKLVVTLVGGAHSDGDLTVYVEPDRVLFSGDIIFEGRVAYLGDADTKHWLEVLQKMETAQLVALIPGHGPAAQEPNKAISMTRHYLAYIREVMGAAVENLTEFDEAYAAADWSEFKDLPAFEAANRRNAYQVYLSMEAEQFKQ